LPEASQFDQQETEMNSADVTVASVTEQNRQT